MPKGAKTVQARILTQQSASASGWHNPKREIDQQIYNRIRLEERALLSTSILGSAHHAKQIVDDDEHAFTSVQKRAGANDYENAQKNALRDLDALNRFYSALGKCLRDAREDDQK
jgi:hypothetical protein